ncbi:MAG: hypothetical protein DRP45_06690 [Candidatus Zixiibacteriota bacterium]|nr:MAG: hypothetical protein DRP45_06690 [candidate division Zixibacteria bacterium]
MTTKNIVFVGAYEGNENRFQEVRSKLGDEWEAESVANAAEALKVLDELTPKVIVSMMKLPDMDGSELLKQASEKYPRMIRFLVSDETDRATAMKSVGYVHRLVPSSLDPCELRKMIENSVDLRDLMANEELCDRIAAVGSLPSPPETYNKLVSELKNENTSVRKIAELVGQDVAITAKLFQMINSAYFGLSGRVESVSHAINLLGLDTVQSIVLSAGVFNQFEDPGLKEYSIESIYNRSMAVGAKARLLAHAFGLSRGFTEDALMSGMLHDVGKLLMLTEFEVELKESIQLAKSDSLPLYKAQHEVLGVSDAAMGAYLLSLWGLPDTILEAVALHYEPSQSPGPILNALTAVHLAYAMDYDDVNKVKDKETSAVDMDYLTSLEIVDQLPSLQNFCTGAVV